MSKFKESEAVVARCSSKKVLSKISQITQEKHPCWSFPSTKPQALRLAALLKRYHNIGNHPPPPLHLSTPHTPHPPPPSPSLHKPTKPPRTLLSTEHLQCGNLWRKAKYDLVRGQFPYSQTKTRGITLNWFTLELLTNPDHVGIIKFFVTKKAKVH